MTRTVRILIVDDEPSIHRFLKPALAAAGYNVLSAMDAASGLRSLAQDAPDVVVLDLGLPDLDGKDFIRQARAWSTVPIVVLSARDREAEKIESLDLGADDFVNKPFGVGELLARLRAAIRHAIQGEGGLAVFTAGPLTVDIPRHLVSLAGEPVRLTPREFDLLALLARNAGKVVTHRQLLTAVWGPAHEQDTQYLRVYVGQLREKIEKDPSDPRLLVTEPGIGYRLTEQ
jgi:two-component system, OmpR family, KDP operon response regulator KdpE